VELVVKDEPITTPEAMGRAYAVIAWIGAIVIFGAAATLIAYLN
jgi:hypothetical protein